MEKEHIISDNLETQIEIINNKDFIYVINSISSSIKLHYKFIFKQLKIYDNIITELKSLLLSNQSLTTNINTEQPNIESKFTQNKATIEKELNDFFNKAKISIKSLKEIQKKNSEIDDNKQNTNIKNKKKSINKGKTNKEFRSFFDLNESDYIKNIHKNFHNAPLSPFKYKKNIFKSNLMNRISTFSNEKIKEAKYKSTSKNKNESLSYSNIDVAFANEVLDLVKKMKNHCKDINLEKHRVNILNKCHKIILNNSLNLSSKMLNKNSDLKNCLFLDTNDIKKVSELKDIINKDKIEIDDIRNENNILINENNNLKVENENFINLQKTNNKLNEYYSSLSNELMSNSNSNNNIINNQLNDIIEHCNNLNSQNIKLIKTINQNNNLIKEKDRYIFQLNQQIKNSNSSSKKINIKVNRKHNLSNRKSKSKDKENKPIHIPNDESIKINNHTIPLSPHTTIKSPIRKLNKSALDIPSDKKQSCKQVKASHPTILINKKNTTYSLTNNLVLSPNFSNNKQIFCFETINDTNNLSYINSFTNRDNKFKYRNEKNKRFQNNTINFPTKKNSQCPNLNRTNNVISRGINFLIKGNGKEKELNDVISSIQKELEDKDRELNKCKNTINSSNIKITNLLNDIIDKGNNITALNEEIDQKVKKINELNDIIITNNKTILEKDEKINKLKLSTDKINSNTGEVKTNIKIKISEYKISSLNIELINTSNKIQIEKINLNKIENLEKELDAIKSENKKLKEETDRLNKEKTEKIEKLDLDEENKNQKIENNDSFGKLTFKNQESEDNISLKNINIKNNLDELCNDIINNSHNYNLITQYSYNNLIWYLFENKSNDNINIPYDQFTWIPDNKINLKDLNINGFNKEENNLKQTYNDIANQSLLSKLNDKETEIKLIKNNLLMLSKEKEENDKLIKSLYDNLNNKDDEIIKIKNELNDQIEENNILKKEKEKEKEKDKDKENTIKTNKELFEDENEDEINDIINIVSSKQINDVETNSNNDMFYEDKNIDSHYRILYDELISKFNRVIILINQLIREIKINNKNKNIVQEIINILNINMNKSENKNLAKLFGNNKK